MRVAISCAVLVPACWSQDRIPAPCRAEAEVEVSRVIDGDTLEISPSVALPDGTTVTRFRLLCIDAPESGSECYDEESAGWLADQVLGRRVRLVFDEDCADIYGRGLAYVVVGARNLSVESAAEGFAVLIDAPFDDATWCPEVAEAADEARAAGRGGWGACAGAPWVE